MLKVLQPLACNRKSFSSDTDSELNAGLSYKIPVYSLEALDASLSDLALHLYHDTKNNFKGHSEPASSLKSALNSLKEIH